MNLIRTLRSSKLFVFLTAAMLGLTFGSASADVNLHHGMIRIENSGKLPIEVSIEAFGWGKFTQPKVRIAPGTTLIANQCCYAAGSTYVVRVNLVSAGDGVTTTMTDTHEYPVDARLCNTNGIPYGYAAMRFWDNRPHPSVAVLGGGRADRGCP